MNYQTISDEGLLALVARAQENALSELYDRYSRLVYSIAMNSTGDPAMAEEITQDVFIRVWEKAETYRAGAGKVVTWIASITRYRAIDILRRMNVRPEGNRSGHAWEDLDPLPDGANVEEAVQSAERRRRVQRAISQLPPEQQLALAYAYFQGYSHSEIANLLQEPLGTVKTRIRLGMQKLRQLLVDDK